MQGTANRRPVLLAQAFKSEHATNQQSCPWNSQTSLLREMHAKDDTVLFNWSTSAGCSDMEHLIVSLAMRPLLAVYDRLGFLLNFPHPSSLKIAVGILISYA